MPKRISRPNHKDRRGEKLLRVELRLAGCSELAVNHYFRFARSNSREWYRWYRKEAVLCLVDGDLHYITQMSEF
jgi:hypothetical protein